MGVFTTSKQFALEIDMPGWWLVGSSVDLDFVHGRYFDSSLSAPAAVGNLLSISRASIGYAKTLSGTLTQFASAQLRITDLGLLIEDARTNLVTWSSDLSNTSGPGWGLVDVTFGSGTDPSGSTSNVHAIGSTNNSQKHFTPNTFWAITSGTARPFTFSVFFKNDSAGQSGIYMTILDNNSNGWQYNIDTSSMAVTGSSGAGTPFTSESHAIETFGGGWFRFTSTFTCFTTSSSLWTNIYPNNSNSFAGDGIHGVYIFGPQVEEASFASSYIPTTTTAATRAADAVTTASNLQTVIATATGSLVAQTDRGEAAGIASNIIDSNGTNLLGFNSSNNALASITATLATGNAGNRTTQDKIGLAWSGAGRSLVLNGSTVATDASAQTPSSTQHIGSSGSANFAYAYIERLTAFNSKLADATLQSFTQ